MTNPTPPEVEATAQKIQDYFFSRGARVSKIDWDWLTTTLTDQHAKHEAEKATMMASVLKEIDDYQLFCNHEHIKLLVTKNTLIAFDLHSRMVACKHIKEKISAITPTTDTESGGKGEINN